MKFQLNAQRVFPLFLKQINFLQQIQILNTVTISSSNAFMVIFLPLRYSVLLYLESQK